MFRKFLLLALVLMLAASMVRAQEDTFALTIMHTNDTHTWHEPQSNGDGGVTRQATVVKQIRESVENSLLLDAGDRFTGTLYQVQFRGAENARIMNQLGYDAMTLGNHEFDDGEDVLQGFVDALNFPVVTANVDFTAFPALDEKINAFTVLDVNGQQIGIIGLTTADTVTSSSPSADVGFSSDLVAATQAAVDALTEQGVNKIVLLTHLGISDDLALIPQLSGVDVVLGGHSHTLISNRFVAALDETGRQFAYPVTLENANGERIFYAQAGERNIFMGRLDVVFNAEGEVTTASGDVILLSRYITPDAEMQALMDELKPEIDTLRAQPTGATAPELLVGNRAVCRVEACPLGVLLAEAMLADTGAQIAITNGGGIRADIDAGEITVGDVFTVLPFGNTIATFRLTGADVVAALENGVSRISVNEGVVTREGANGRFPQVAGLRFSFDPTQEAGSRIVSVEVRAADGSFAPIDPAAEYTIASNDFMRNGGDGYSVFRDNAIDAYDFGTPLNDALVTYLVANEGNLPAVDDRITLVNATVAPMP
jgi:5'-nucleotidase / UDP-sugar diphosphatase